MDIVGAVSSGVVNYTVKIGFDTDDDNVKPGMTVTANIIAEMKQEVLAIPSSAVKSQGDISYVEIVEGNSNSLTRVGVETGISNDESIEIISGLAEGDQYVARTITSQATTQPVSAPSLFGGGGNFPRQR